MEKNKSVPFRILGTLHGNPIILRTYANCVVIAINGKRNRFRTYNEAMTYLQTITKRKSTKENIADDIPKLLDSGCILDYSESEYNELFDTRLNQQIDLFINQYCEGNKDLYEDRIGQLTVYKTKEELEKFLEDTVRFKFKSNIACLAIAEKENITVEGDDYDVWLANALKMQNISDKEKFFALYDTPYQSGRDYINEQYLYEKVMQLLSKNVNVIYSDDVLVTDVIKASEDLSK